jgi:hypothetical protein
MNLKNNKMAQLTAQQANELADNFSGMAQAIEEYRQHNFDILSKKENKEIKDLYLSVLNYADELYTLSATLTLVMDNVKSSLSSINEVTNNMKDTCKTLQNVQKAINVASSVVTLGAAILSKNTQTIADSIKGLVDTWKG